MSEFITPKQRALFMDTNPADEKLMAAAAFENSIHLNSLPEIRQHWMSDLGSPVRNFKAPMDRQFLCLIKTNEPLITRLVINGASLAVGVGAAYFTYNLLERFSSK